MVDPVSRALAGRARGEFFCAFHFEANVCRPGHMDARIRALRSLLFPPAQRKSRVQLYFDVVRAQADAAGIAKDLRGEYLREVGVVALVVAASDDPLVDGQVCGGGRGGK
ncbi:hypothetical protein PLICRDRAFT_567990 [Plicaturopsis crispa FD-325 SS-3]|nr:hypothetical protein PLICRDRAFT_567990 [Plicaturopsis crispa FD-325 SS-3]